MTFVYDLYGAEELCILSAKDNVERALGENFEERDSSYHGGVYYMWGRSDSGNFILKLNIDPFDGEPVEVNYPSHKILLYVNATRRSSDIEGVIGKSGCFKLLRHETF